ncbi:MAG: phosphate acetyltransferase, partial [Coriobacteriales bacterium]|nr:phosphate acetyltransferase [Coriobacteriales bacterium]
MSWFLEGIEKRAAADLKRIVLPEGDDPRTLAAALKIRDRKIAQPVVLANMETDTAGATGAAYARGDVDFTGIELIDPRTSPSRQTYAERLYELRREKGLTEDAAFELAGDVLHYGVLMVKDGEADGMVAGAAHATSDVLRPALQIIKTAPG